MQERSGKTSGQARSLRHGLAKTLMACNLPGLALKTAVPLDMGTATDKELLQLLQQASSQCGDQEQAHHYEVMAFRRSALASLDDADLSTDIRGLLESAAGLEKRGNALPRKAAAALASISQRTDICETIATVCSELRTSYPASVLLTYFEASALARLERFGEANSVVHSAVLADEKCARPSKANAFAKISRIVDAISRDLMAWSSKQQADNISQEETASTPDGIGDNVKQVLSFKAMDTEVLLQARMQQAYLKACRHRFDSATDVKDQVAAIKAMMRQGLRRMPSYHQAYDEARQAYADMGSERLARYAQEVLDRRYSADNPLAATRQLVELQKLAQELGFDVEAEHFERTLAEMLVRLEHKDVAWVIADALVRIDCKKHRPATTKAILALGVPKKDYQIRSFFMWALHARKYKIATEVFNKLPLNAQKSVNVYEYVRILQRMGKFSEALTLADRITETIFINISKLDPWRSWTLKRRADEIRFLKDTAHWFGQVPQPAYPKGVVMFAPRNAYQLTKYPLVVLMELKKRGWAVIPLIEGVMRRELTSDPRINKFIGCITAEGEIAERLADQFTEIDDLVADLSRGRFAWAGKDLSQVLWEEAAINRRRYHIDFTCPTLQPFLDRLVNWTRVIGTVLRTAHQDLSEMQLRVGTLVSFQARLPDVMVRFYCEERGNPDNFFCLHATNGYENYFANFSRSYSMKAGLRNMTANPELRTASFPIPKRFSDWYEQRSACISDNLARVQSVEKVRRVARDSVLPPQRAVELKNELLRWKANGGRVACLFGKVVCDLAAPTDGGPAHRNMKDWLNHAIDSVRGSHTMLLIKPHPHELRAEIATFLTEKLEDLIEVPLPHNVKIIPADWFDVDDIAEIVDLGVIYNGTTAIELGRASVPAVLCSYFAPIDYPIGHAVPRDRDHFRRLMRFEEMPVVADDLAERAAAWITYMSSESLAVQYRYHYRPLTNKITSAPYWFTDDVESYLYNGDKNVSQLVDRILERHQ